MSAAGFLTLRSSSFDSLPNLSVASFIRRVPDYSGGGRDGISPISLLSRIGSLHPKWVTTLGLIVKGPMDREQP